MAKKKKLTALAKLKLKVKDLELALKHQKALLATQVQATEYQRKRFDQENNEKICANTAKDRYYTETNQKTAKIARLEKAVTSLKEGMQKTLLAFDVLN